MNLDQVELKQCRRGGCGMIMVVIILGFLNLPLEHAINQMIKQLPQFLRLGLIGQRFRFGFEFFDKFFPFELPLLVIFSHP